MDLEHDGEIKRPAAVADLRSDRLIGDSTRARSGVWPALGGGVRPNARVVARGLQHQAATWQRRAARAAAASASHSNLSEQVFTKGAGSGI